LTGSLGFDRVGQVNLYFLKNSIQRRFSKKKKSMGCNRVFDRVLPGQAGRRVGRVTPGHDFFYFFINPARFQPRVNPPDRTGFQNY
jgi:hypothetical protein